MYIRSLIILLLYGYIAGESDDSNSTRTHLKTDIKPNRRAGSDIPSVHKGLNNKYGTAIIAHVPTISKIVAPVQKDDSNESSNKSSLWEDELADSEIKLQIDFDSDHTDDKIKKSFKNATSSELLQAEGTYHVQQYFQPPVMQNQHYMQRLPSYYNWQQTDYNYNSRNDPCASYSAPHHYLHLNHNNRGVHSQYDPYQAQGTYNIQYYMPPNQQMNQYPSQNSVPRHMWAMNYNNRQLINPCMPSRPLPPPSTGYQIYPHPNPPKPRTYLSPPRDIFPDDSYFPKKQTFFPPPPHVYTKIPPPHPPPEPSTYQTPPSVKVYTPTWPPPRPHGCSIWNKNGCHISTPPPYTPCIKGQKIDPYGRCVTPPTRTPPTYTPCINGQKIDPYGRCVTPPTRTPPTYTPCINGQKIDPYGRCVTPTTRKPIGTPPPPRTKGYTY